jgi:hypothetical protein
MAGWLRRRAARVPRPPRRSSRRAGPRPRVDAPESAPQDCSFDCDRIVLRAAPADHFLPINFIALARVSSAAREICRCINDTSGRRILHGLILFSPPAVSSLHFLEFSLQFQNAGSLLPANKTPMPAATHSRKGRLRLDNPAASPGRPKALLENKIVAIQLSPDAARENIGSKAKAKALREAATQAERMDRYVRRAASNTRRLFRQPARKRPHHVDSSSVLSGKRASSETQWFICARHLRRTDHLNLTIICHTE